MAKLRMNQQDKVIYFKERITSTIKQAIRENNIPPEAAACCLHMIEFVVALFEEGHYHDGLGSLITLLGSCGLSLTQVATELGISKQELWNHLGSMPLTRAEKQSIGQELGIQLSRRDKMSCITEAVGKEIVARASEVFAPYAAYWEKVAAGPSTRIQ